MAALRISSTAAISAYEKALNPFSRITLSARSIICSRVALISHPSAAFRSGIALNLSQPLPAFPARCFRLPGSPGFPGPVSPAPRFSRPTRPPGFSGSPVPRPARLLTAFPALRFPRRPHKSTYLLVSKQISHRRPPASAASSSTPPGSTPSTRYPCPLPLPRYLPHPLHPSRSLQLLELPSPLLLPPTPRTPFTPPTPLQLRGLPFPLPLLLLPLPQTSSYFSPLPPTSITPSPPSPFPRSPSPHPHRFSVPTLILSPFFAMCVYYANLRTVFEEQPLNKKRRSDFQP